MSERSITLFVDPPSHHTEGDRLFELSTGAGGGDDILMPFVRLRDELRRRGVGCRTADFLDEAPINGGLNLYLSLGGHRRVERLARRRDVVLSAFFGLEAPIVEPSLYRTLPRIAKRFKRVYSYSTTEALREFTRDPVELLPARLPQAYRGVHEGLWERDDRKFLVMISGNKLPRLYVRELYTERLRAVEFFERHGEIDLYGVGWEGPPYRMGATWMPATLRTLDRSLRMRWRRLRPSTDPVWSAVRRCYLGSVDSKAQVMSAYTFAICFENMILDGWVTEKLFDCLFAGTVPVYWGAPDIERWVPSECFVDMRRFSGYEELREYLHQLSPTEIQAFKDAGREYVRSERYEPFTTEHFIEMVLGIVEEDAAAAPA